MTALRDTATETTSRAAVAQTQRRATQPRVSAWIAANAGTGKTHVLTNRVARLLLADVQPQKILCLTYTKAAASEMHNRLLAQLGRWAMQDEATLLRELAALGDDIDADPGALGRTRRLFAQAIETPGGLKIQTIHSFCATVLRRFPLEAGVSPLFQEMDEHAATLLCEQVAETMAAGEDSARVQALAHYVSGESLAPLLGDICRHRAAFSGAFAAADLAKWLKIPAGMTQEKLLKTLFSGDEKPMLQDLAKAMEGGSPNDRKAAAQLRDVLATGLTDPVITLPALEKIFLNGEGAKDPHTAKIGKLPTKNLRRQLAEQMPQVEAFMQKVEQGHQQRLALDVLAAGEAMHRFAHRFLKHYQARKQALGWLDFDDLILTTKALLENPQVAQWVLYRLDGGVDHILVDEAQDTSAAQWQIIDHLAQEITAGQGVDRQGPRTIFAVGDTKQSIYGFQGAEPARFTHMRARFAKRLQNAPAPLETHTLQHSFRSSQAILGVVDRYLAHSALEAPQHRAYFDTMPGRVDLWAFEPKAEKPPAPPWHCPQGTLHPPAPTRVLAERIAKELRRMIDEATPIPDKLMDNGSYSWRGVRAGDVLILVQRRSDLFHDIIRACKRNDLPIAGVDRLRVGAELAVRDLTALLAFLATPADDMALAIALRSPLLGLAEQDLFTLAHGRKQKRLWQVLRHRAAEFPQTKQMLAALLGKVDILRPYELLEHILTYHGGRRCLLARLGVEAEEGIDALLMQALAYERNAVPSLTGFLAWLREDSLEVKRQLDSKEDQIRVMTVHGAKGLQAPIVILPDTGQQRPRSPSQGSILTDGAGAVLWAAPGLTLPRSVSALRDQEKEKQKQERKRLLYVAMTRAEKWLIVAGAGDKGKEDTSCWYAALEAVMQGAPEAQACTLPGGRGMRVEEGRWHSPPCPLGGPASSAPKPQKPPPLDPCFARAVPPPKPLPPRPLTPSDLGGAKTLAAESPHADARDTDLPSDPADAKAWGSCLHLLLEHLPGAPTSEHPQLAQRILRNAEAPDFVAHAPALLAEAQGILENPDLAFLFAKNTLAEVPLNAQLGGRRLNGVIDRLCVADTQVLAVDFKTNKTVPQEASAIPDGLVRQMAAYGAALRQIYPKQPIQLAILWTRTAQLMYLPPPLVAQALAAVLSDMSEAVAAPVLS